ncbi:TetR/AcrR family transcriptional regulator [Burkholderia stagnalis]|uniref:TetR/AcrR family transcriptional regulator n=1 Tax=Burkholderia stagnalis TaxID=1503054 RepID=UPI000753EC55|nr:TetR/AcrR family transcriptional regulator [Burkholderia stagnalis]KVM90619.1 TetR family transcriptional regulator [Burkholderia stagnalis]KWD96966.1 TetR family transcriptional regulator [Burkholderia stagnalis]KWE11901.1 TetR family transcriptional regulator [Burkholderia stagnalis]KWO73918.1 TetR family transcriptional regulator [Burkholderia stagnalis]
MNASSGAEVRQHILNIAKPIMLHKGFSAVGLNEILAAAGIPKGSFYHYFGSKEAFGEALLESYFDGYLEHLDNLLLRQAGTGAERLMSYWTNWQLTQCNDDPQGKCLAVKLGAEVSDLSEAMRSVLRRGTAAIIERLAAGIEAGLADGSLRGIDDSRQTAAVLYELWLGATLLEKIHRDRKAIENAMAATLRMLNLPAAAGEHGAQE